MTGKTVIRFIGRLSKKFPEMTGNAVSIASGNVLSWISGSLKVLDSAGDIIAACSEKRNTKLMEKEMNRMTENIEAAEDEKIYKAEQKILASKIKAIQKIKAEFEGKREELSKNRLDAKLSGYANIVKEYETISAGMQNLRNNLKALIDELSELHTVESYKLLSMKEQNQYDDCMLLLQRQYNKSIEI